ncbi:MAG: TolC family protein [Candidatus Omnitrophica bacterium]|nr:TolC family protein [Candidatus Omnitrophota bacterium]
MIKLKRSKRLLWLIAFWFIFPSFSLHAAALGPNPVSADDERKIEKDREQAILEAMAAIEPSLAAKSIVVAEAPEDRKAEIIREVERLRHARKQQFKHLSDSYIKQMVTPETVGEKEQFLIKREKNLEDILIRSMRVSVQTEVAKQRVTLAKFRIAKALRDFFPEAAFEADVKKGSLSAPAFTSDHWRMKFRIPVFRGGVLWNTLLLERANLEVARREYDKTVSDLIADVSQAYFEYERASNVLRDRRQLMEKAKGQKKFSDEKYRAKLISEIEKLNSDSLYSQAQYDLETAQQEVEIAKLELQKYLSLETNDPIEISSLYSVEALKVESLKKNPFGMAAQGMSGKFENDLDRFIELAYENRPDLQVEASKLKATQLAYRVSLGQRLPQFDFLLEFGELAEAFIVDTDDPNHQHEFRFGMEASWPFLGNTLKYTYDHDQRAPSVTQFQGGAGTRIRSNTFSAELLDDLGQFSSMLEAKVNNLEQIVELEKTEREVVRDVKEAYFNFNKALIQVESAYKRMDYRARLAQLAKHRLDTNEIQISEYLQAEMDFTEERSLLYKALSDFFLSKTKLNRAIGIRDYLAVKGLS